MKMQLVSTIVATLLSPVPPAAAKHLGAMTSEKITLLQRRFADAGCHGQKMNFCGSGVS